NANLCAIIPNLKLKMGIDCISWEELARLTEVSRYVAEIANLIHDNHMAYVGASAFAHKAGYHADGMLKEPTSYQHVDPALVGNEQRILVSELSGKASILGKAREFGIELGSKEAAAAFFERVKELEKQGYQFEGAEAS
ncbi:MAG: citramalate synthase, partial [Chloroflexota bacterium]